MIDKFLSCKQILLILCASSYVQAYRFWVQIALIKNPKIVSLSNIFLHLKHYIQLACCANTSTYLGTSFQPYVYKCTHNSYIFRESSEPVHNVSILFHMHSYRE